MYYDHVSIGRHVKIGPNSVIGHYAFYYKQQEGKHEQMHSIGNVKLMTSLKLFYAHQTKVYRFYNYWRRH